MKKLLSVFAFLGVIFCLTGCGNKPSTLTCSQKISGVDATITANFVGKEVKAMKLDYSMDLSKYSDTQIKAIEKQDFCTSVQRAISQFTLVDCSQSVENKVLLVKSGIDLSKMSNSDLVGSPEATKTSLEKSGFTCELK